MKTYVLTVSRYFPTTHKRKGEETGFVDKIIMGIGCPDCEYTQDLSGLNISPCNSCHRHAMVDKKIHTIRANYELWAKRINEVQEGKAILSIRYWSGKPYNSKQVEVCQLDKDSGIGVQKLEFNGLHGVINGEWITPDILAKNDGLSYEDFREWFKNYDIHDPMAIIHFTSFRY